MKLNTYLTFNGDCEEAMNYYKDIFDGEFITFMRYKDGPPEYVNDSNEEKVMHVTMQFHGCELLASDAMGGPTTKGSAYHLSVGIDNEEEAATIFNSLADGGKVEMPFQDVFWGGKFGSVIDKFGIQWMVSAEHAKDS